MQRIGILVRKHACRLGGWRLSSGASLTRARCRMGGWTLLASTTSVISFALLTNQADVAAATRTIDESPAYTARVESSFSSRINYQIPRTTTVSSYLPDDTYELTLTHEVIDDPGVSSTFHTIGPLSIARDGRLYYLDTGDKDVKVFSPELEHVLSFAKPGQGPGELGSPYRTTISPNGLLYIFDNDFLGFHSFTLEGEYVDRLRVTDHQFYSAPRAFLVLDDDSLWVSAGALSEGMYGHAIHRFEIINDGSRRALKYKDSFGEAVAYDPSLYDLVGGALRRDTDGGVLYGQMNPYSIRKYSSAGALLWRIDDDVMRPAADYFTVNPRGGIVVNPYAETSMVVPYDDARLLHVMYFPVSAVVEGAERPAIVIELLPRPEAEVPRLAFRIDELFLIYDHMDSERRLYGRILMEDGTRVSIRSRVAVHRVASQGSETSEEG